MAEVGIAYVTIAPSFKGFKGKLAAQISPEADKAGKSSGSKFGIGFGKAVAAVGGVAAIGGIIKKSSQLEQEFGKTMNVLQATSNASGSEMAKLSTLAKKMGADTVFSANDASRAMLELARGGISPAQIQAGALQGTLTLAAAGELGLSDAANIAVKSMGQFGLAGKDAASVAAALAGGANASSASVGDMAQALAQGGLAANSVGFSLQETTGILAAFSNSGLEGADAGTSLKTLLDRLQPATESAADAFDTLGIFSEKTGSKFVKANGEFKSAAQIAELLKKGTEGLTDAEAKRAITQAFGSDAQRAATILAKEGAAGIKALTKQTSDQSAAEKQAAANTAGTAGAIEKLAGSAETAQLAIGQALAPTIVDVANFLSRDAVPAVTSFIDGMRTGTGAGGALADDLGTVVDVGKDVLGVGKDVYDVFTSLPGPVKEYGIKAAVAAIAVKKLADAGKGISGLAAIGGIGGGKVAGKGFGGLGGGRSPVPVYVTNLGKAGIGPAAAGGAGAGGGKGKGRGASRGAGAGIAATAVLGLGALSTTLDDVGSKGKETGNKLFASFDKPKGGVAEFLFGPGNTMQADFQRAIASLNAGKAGKIGADLDQAFGGSSFSTGVANVRALDSALAKLSKSDRVGAMDAYYTAARNSGLSTAQFAQALPKATSALRSQAQATGSVGSLMRQTIPQLARYDTVLKGFPKAAITEIATNGLPETRRGIVDLVSKYNLTPDMVSTLIRETGSKPTRGSIEGIILAAKTLDGQRPNPRVGLLDFATRPMGAIDRTLAGLNRKVARPKVQLDTTGFFGAIGQVVAALDNAARPRTSTITTSRVGAGPKGIAGARALGGPVRRGKTYLVGERGPEIFTAAVSGRITSAADSRAKIYERAQAAAIPHIQAMQHRNLEPLGLGAGGKVSLAVNGPVTLMVGDREMQAWFEDSFDAEMALN